MSLFMFRNLFLYVFLKDENELARHFKMNVYCVRLYFQLQRYYFLVIYICFYSLVHVCHNNQGFSPCNVLNKCLTNQSMGRILDCFCKDLHVHIKFTQSHRKELGSNSQGF